VTPIKALHHHAQLRSNSVAFIYEGDVWTYGRLATDVERLAHGLVERGIQRGDRVALHMTNTPELVLAYYACFRIGAVAAPLNIRFKAPELASLLRRLQPSLYIGQEDLYNNVAAIDSSILASNARFVIGDTIMSSGAMNSLAQSWTTLFSDVIGAPLLCEQNFHAPALLLTTSDAADQPKFVAHTPETISAAINSFEYRALDGDQIAIAALPMDQAGGLFSFLACVQFGAPAILFRQFDSNAILDAIEDFRCGWILLLPFMFAALLEHQRQHPRDVSSLRSCLACGDICPTDLQAQFSAYFGVALHSLWDAAEAPGSLTYGLGSGSVSRISPGTQARLVDESGAPVAHGKIGELLLRGPNITIGYWREPGLIDNAMRDGWFHTGDLMQQDERGDFRLVSSREELIVRPVSKISPAEVAHAFPRIEAPSVKSDYAIDRLRNASSALHSC